MFWAGHKDETQLLLLSSAYTVGSAANLSPAGRRLSKFGSALLTSMAVTREEGGPWRQDSINPSIACFSPNITASTEPSRRFLTHPSSPRVPASSSTNARYPTPCTSPLMDRCTSCFILRGWLSPSLLSKISDIIRGKVPLFRGGDDFLDVIGRGSAGFVANRQVN